MLTPSRRASLIRAHASRIPLRDGSVQLIVTSPPYFALRDYRDGDERLDGQIGSEPTPTDFLRSLWAVADECWRVLAPTGVMFVNLGDKFSGSGGHNNNGLTRSLDGVGTSYANGDSHVRAARRNGPDRYNQASDAAYLRLADWRIHKSGHAAKTEARTWAERQGQLL